MENWSPQQLFTGGYNEGARPQAEAAAQGYAAWEAAAREVPLGSSCVIADIAASEGRNSMEMARRAIAVLRSRQEELFIEVAHTDLAANDFNALLRLATGPEGYCLPAVFPSARPGNFYYPLFPPDTVHLAWCSTATHWLSRIPPDGNWPEQARADWDRWIDCRHFEMVPGGQVVIVGSGADALGRTRAEGLTEMVRMTLGESLPVHERIRLALPTYHRRMEEWLAPLEGRFRVQEASEPEMPDPFWDELQKTGDAEAYADRVVGFVEASFHQPILRVLPSASAWRQRLRERVLAHPEQARCRWWLAVLRLEKV